MKTLEQTVIQVRDEWARRSLEQQALEEANNRAVAELYDLADEVPSEVPLERVSLKRNSAFVYPNKTPAERDALFAADQIEELVSYAVGCMFGRYSLDKPGLILADQGSTLADYLAKVPEPTFMPDEDGVLPVVDGEWFADDIVARFREFLRVAFGEANLAENLRYAEAMLRVGDMREYFISRAGKSRFYDDHVKRYKKRPIYWMFSSPKGAFNALIYLHRYAPSTVSIVLNEYLREYQAKLEQSLTHQERLATSPSSSPREAAQAQKEADRLRKVMVELDAYEHDVLYPLAARRVALDLDDGVKANYPKLGAALRKIPGLEASSD